MLNYVFGTIGSFFSTSDSLPTQSEPGPSTAVPSSSSSHSPHQETISECSLFAECVNFINDRNYEDLYNCMLRNSASLWVNELNPETHINLLHYATLANDDIAFDIVMLFGAKIDSNWLTILMQKINKSGVSLSEKLYDRIINIISNTYILPEKADILDRMPPHLRNRLTKVFIENLTLHCDPNFIEKTPQNFFNALNVIVAYPAFIDLIKDATLGHPYIVKFALPGEIMTRGDCDQYHHVIRVRRDLAYPEMLRVLIFELCNAANKEFYGIVPHDYSNRDDYAYACEKSEYNSLLRSNKVLEGLLIDERLDAFRSKDGKQTLAHYFRRILELKFKSFEQCWVRQNEIIPPQTISHTDHYRLDYDRYHQLMNIINERLVNALDLEPTLVESTTQPVIFTNIHPSECPSNSQQPTHNRRPAPALTA